MYNLIRWLLQRNTALYDNAVVFVCSVDLELWFYCLLTMVCPSQSILLCPWNVLVFQRSYRMCTYISSPRILNLMFNTLKLFFSVPMMESPTLSSRVQSDIQILSKVSVCVCTGGVMGLPCSASSRKALKMNLCRTVLCHRLCQTWVTMVTWQGSGNPSRWN